MDELRRHDRRRLVTGCVNAVMVVLLLAVVAAARGFPYVAYVKTSDAHVLSGPGVRHYHTGKLPAGYAVEVFRHDGQRWCAIRPPQGEFSLVASRQLRVLDERRAEVAAVADKVVARVGSQLSDNASAVQVMLKPGEMVEVLQAPQPGDEWVRIAPPSGEFRWIDAADLSGEPPTESGAVTSAMPAEITGVASSGARWRSPNAARTSDNTNPDDAFAHLTAAVSPETDVVHPASANSTPPTTQPASTVREVVISDDYTIVAGSPAELLLSQLQQAQYQQTPSQQPPPATDARGAEETVKIVPPPLYSPDARGTAASGLTPVPTTTAPVDATAVASPTPNSVPPRIQFPGRGVAPPANQRVAELQVQLSQSVVQPPQAWNLAAIRAETAALLAQEQDPMARGQFRDLLDRIAVFEQVQSRYTNPPPLVAARAVRPGTAATAEPDATSLPDNQAQFTGDTRAVRERIANDLSTRAITPTPGSESQPQADAPADAVDAIDEKYAGPNQIGGTPADPFEASEAQYDAVGTLKPVVSRRANAPRYALVADDGDVAAFVTPGPDVNLSRYIGRRIGVHGTRGFMPDYRRSHVTATRVQSLGEIKRR